MAQPLPWTAFPGAVRLAVRVTPKAGRTALGGVIAMPDGRTALAVRTAAPPVEGAANLALVAFLAKTLGVGKSAVTIAGGPASRHKMVEVRGNPDALAERLQLALS